MCAVSLLLFWQHIIPVNDKEMLESARLIEVASEGFHHYLCGGFKAMFLSYIPFYCTDFVSLKKLLFYIPRIVCIAFSEYWLRRTS